MTIPPHALYRASYNQLGMQAEGKPTTMYECLGFTLRSLTHMMVYRTNPAIAGSSHHSCKSDSPLQSHKHRPPASAPAPSTR